MRCPLSQAIASGEGGPVSPKRPIAAAKADVILREPALSCSVCMINLLRGILIAIALLVATPQFALAQLTDIPGFDKVLAQIQQSLDGNRVLFREAVEMTQGDMRFYADYVEYYIDTNRMVATGNVLLIETDHQIAADRADFNARTRLGTFYNARGFATLAPPPGGPPTQAQPSLTCSSTEKRSRRPARILTSSPTADSRPASRRTRDGK